MEAVLISVTITAAIFASLLTAARLQNKDPETQRLERKKYVRDLVQEERDTETGEGQSTESKERGSRLRQMLRDVSKG